MTLAGRLKSTPGEAATPHGAAPRSGRKFSSIRNVNDYPLNHHEPLNRYSLSYQLMNYYKLIITL